MIRAATDANPKLQVMVCWKSFTTVDEITFIEAVMDELKPETANACWKNLWSEAIHDFKSFPGIKGEVMKIIRTEREGGEGYVDMTDEEVEEHIKEHQEVLMNNELEDLVKSSTEEEETEVEPAMWTMEKFGEVFWMAQNLKEKIMDYDPVMKYSIKVTCMITEALQPLQQMFNELKRQTQQLPIMMFFHKVKKKKSVHY